MDLAYIAIMDKVEIVMTGTYLAEIDKTVTTIVVTTFVRQMGHLVSTAG